MTTTLVPTLSAAERRRRLAVGLLRALAITVVLLAGYYLLPLKRLSSVPMWLTLAVGLLALAGRRDPSGESGNSSALSGLESGRSAGYHCTTVPAALRSRLRPHGCG